MRPGTVRNAVLFLAFAAPVWSQVVGVQGMSFDRARPAPGSVWKFNGRYWEAVPDLMYEGWENLQVSFASSSSITLQAGTPNVIAGCYLDSGESVIPQSVLVQNDGSVQISFGQPQSGWCVINRSRQTILAGQHDNLSFPFSSQTSVTLEHGSSGAVMTACYDADGYQIYPDSIVNSGSSTAVSFSQAQSGRCVVNRLVIDSQAQRANALFSVPAQQQTVLTHNAGVKSVLTQCFNGSGAWFIPGSVEVPDKLRLVVKTDGSFSASCLVNRSSWGGPQVVATSGILTGLGTASDPVRVSPDASLASLQPYPIQIPESAVPAFQCVESSTSASGVQPSDPVLAVWPALPPGLSATVRAADGAIQTRLCNATESDIQIGPGLQASAVIARIVQ